MPLYDFACADGHAVELIRRMANRDDGGTCHCGKALTRQMHITHVAPDGVYSYAPNIGDPERFERQREAIKSGTKTIPRTPSKGDLERWNDPARKKGSWIAT
jgi:putative FmdB family regulatory protein